MEAAVRLLDLELLEVTGPGEAEGVEAATGGHVTDGELVEDGVGEAGAVSPARPTRTTSMARTAQKEGSRSPRGEGATAPGNLSATAVQSSGVQRVRR